MKGPSHRDLPEEMLQRIPGGASWSVEQAHAGASGSRRVRHNQMGLEAGPDLPPELQLVQGPLVRRQGRCHCAFLTHDKTRIGPGDRVATARPMTSEYEKLLDGIHDIQQKQNETREIMATLNTEAHEAARQSHPSDKNNRSSDATFLRTSYKTRGSQARKEALFPDLQEEIENDGRKKANAHRLRDQNSEAYKNEVEKAAAPHIGPSSTIHSTETLCRRCLGPSRYASGCSDTTPQRSRACRRIPNLPWMPYLRSNSLFPSVPSTGPTKSKMERLPGFPPARQDHGEAPPSWSTNLEKVSLEGLCETTGTVCQLANLGCSLAIAQCVSRPRQSTTRVHP